jgi:hypothetical protein
MEVLEVSSEALLYLGVSEAQIRRDGFVAHTQPENIEPVRQAVREAANTLGPAQRFMVDRDGRPMIFHAQPTLQNGRLEVVCFVQYLRQRLFQMAGAV